LVGRARELAEFDQTHDRVASGNPWAIELVGQPGIGKSRLLSELRVRAMERGFLVLEGCAAEFEHDIPFDVFLDALNDYAGSVAPVVRRGLDSEVLEERGSIFRRSRRSLPRVPRGGSRPSGIGSTTRLVHCWSGWQSASRS
jgi:predicted ATPase